MNIVHVIGLAVFAVIAALIIRQFKPEMALVVTLAAGCVILFVVLGSLGKVVEGLQNLAKNSGVQNGYMLPLVQVLGIGYLAEFGSSLCKDAGYASLASKVELAGKVVILLIALPIVTSLMQMIFQLLPS